MDDITISIQNNSFTSKVRFDQKCQSAFRPLCNKISTKSSQINWLLDPVSYSLSRKRKKKSIALYSPLKLEFSMKIISTKSSFDHRSLTLLILQSFKFWEVVYVCRTCHLSKVVIVSFRPMQCTYRCIIYQFGIYSPGGYYSESTERKTILRYMLFLEKTPFSFFLTPRAFLL